ncbi:hypothetical protein ACU4HD_43670 [Cupriavidus basilensis]
MTSVWRSTCRRAQFQAGDVVLMIEQTLADTGLPPTALEVEITESLLDGRCG